jgi:hypothetical protein
VEATDDGDDETGDAIQEMHDQVEELRDQNADLAVRSTSDALRTREGDELHPETERLLGQLDAAGLSEAQERVRSLREQVENLYHEKEVLAEAGLMSSQDALDEIDRLQRTCDRLRSQGESTGEASVGASRNEIAAILGIDSPEEARELDQAVRRLSNRLDDLLDEKESLIDSLGVANADAILDLVESMEHQLSDFYERQERDRSRGGAVASEIESILGVSDAEEARELVSYVHDMNDRLERLSAEQETLHAEGLDAKKAIEIIDSMEAQLVDLYGAADASGNGVHAGGSHVNGEAPSSSSKSSVADILGLSGPSEARELDQLVRRMSTELDRLRTEMETLSDADLTADMALHMIDNMEEQLVALYRAQDASSEQRPVGPDALDALAQVLGVDAPEAVTEETEPVSALTRRAQALLDEGRTALPDADDVASLQDLLRKLAASLEMLREERDVQIERVRRFDALEDILGISTLDEARDLKSLVQNLDEQLQSLYAERQKLNELGLSNVEDAVDMIRSMEHQLQELYQEQEALQDKPLPDHAGQQDTFEQLQSLYKDQEKLKRALGVSDADDVIEMFEDLTAQLEEVYGEQERAAADADDDPGSSSDASQNQTGDDSSAATRLTLDSMWRQLEALYDEREALLRRGFESAEEAAVHIDDLQERLRTLREEYEAHQEQLNRLERELGTTDVDEIVERISASGQPAWSADAPPVPSPPSASAAANDDPFVDAAPSLLPSETLDQLGEMSAEDLDALPVGVLCLGDEGTIEALNEKGLRFPGLNAADHSEVVGDRLFEQVPGTSNALFLGRFKNGVEEGAMDARFPYTFVTPGDRPTVFFVHLYRGGARHPNWLLFQPA